jgi:hypothetical protein
MQHVVVGGYIRLAVAAVLAALATGLTAVGFGLGWGIGWMAWIPAAFLLLPALALAGRREIRRTGQGLEIVDGRLYRRIYAIGLHGGEIEVLPAGGAWTVVVHLDGRELPLASWVSRSTADRIAGLCDLPRRAARRPQGDR